VYLTAEIAAHAEIFLKLYFLAFSASSAVNTYVSFSIRLGIRGQRGAESLNTEPSVYRRFALNINQPV
jgi:hypothetical protein